MRFGICTSFDNLGLLEQLGYDYIEPSIQNIAFLSQEEYEKIQKQVSRSSLRCEAFNVMLPGTLHVVGDDRDLGQLEEYLDRAFFRAAGLGGKIVVFGSGGARRRPDNVSSQQALEQLVEASRIMGECGAKNGITVVSEPLNQGETNTINTVAQGLELVRAVNHPYFQLLADLYHMALEDESAEILTKCEGHLYHVHIANPKGRAYPLDEQEFDYESYAKALKNAGYQMRISVEGRTEQMQQDGVRALALLKNLMNS